MNASNSAINSMFRKTAIATLNPNLNLNSDLNQIDELYGDFNVVKMPWLGAEAS